MCLVALAFRTLPNQGTLIVANRDEFHTRPTQALHAWHDSPEVVAGRDSQAGGTWMGSTAAGRFAFVTNYRDPGPERAGARSRGDLVSSYLQGNQNPQAYMAEIAARGNEYNGFNLIVGTHDISWYYSNMGEAPRSLDAGIYLLSNHLLDSPWPKALRIRRQFDSLLNQGCAIDMGIDAHAGLSSGYIGELTQMMRDTTPAPDASLPQTGLSLERERLLSSPFIVSPDYGTRSTAVMSLDHSGGRWVGETRYGSDGNCQGSTLLTLRQSRPPWADAGDS